MSLQQFATNRLIRRLTKNLTPEVISRTGVRWHNAHNQGPIVSVIRNFIITRELEDDADSYETMRMKTPLAEKDIVRRFLRTGQHAARGHRENVSKIVQSLFIDTPYDPKLVHVKKSVFGVDDGAAIISTRHPALIELLAGPKGEANKLVLFETEDSGAAGESTALGDQSRDIQVTWIDFLANLFHFKHGSDDFGIDPPQWPAKPLFAKKAEHYTVLNEFFCYIYSKAVSWQGMSAWNVQSLSDVETLTTSVYSAIDASKSGPDLPATPYISMTFVAYLEALLGAAPYFKTTDPRNKLEHRFAKALKELNKVEEDKFSAYLGRKLRAWYTKFPPEERKGAGGGSDAEGGGEVDMMGGGRADSGDDGEAVALSDGE